jgi:fimbrial chaperone protein
LHQHFQAIIAPIHYKKRIAALAFKGTLMLDQLKFGISKAQAGVLQAFAALLLFLPLLSVAQQVSVSPLRVTFANEQQSEILSLRNVSKSSFTVQPKVVKWIQRDGQEFFEPTRDIIVAPPIVEVPAGETQVIRLSLRRPPEANAELTYRVFLQQVLAPQTQSGTGLTFAWSLSLPIFVNPSSPVAPANLSWKAELNGKNIDLTATNTGVMHVQVKGVRLEAGASVTTGGQMMYLLAGHTGKMSAPAPAGKSDRIVVVADTDMGEMRREVPLQ